jgi:hypothetical protein
MTKPTCFNGGYYGGPWLVIPDDPHRYRRDDDDVIGCNRLFCEACESPVKHVDKRRIGGLMTAKDYETLYDAPHPEASPFLTGASAATEFRVYYCRCSAHSIAGIEQAGLSDTGWSCAGHPPG